MADDSPSGSEQLPTSPGGEVPTGGTVPPGDQQAQPPPGAQQPPPGAQQPPPGAQQAQPPPGWRMAPGGWQGPPGSWGQEAPGQQPPPGWEAPPGQQPPPGWEAPREPWGQAPSGWQVPPGTQQVPPGPQGPSPGGWYGPGPGDWQGGPWPYGSGPIPGGAGGWGPYPGGVASRRPVRTREQRRRRTRLGLLLAAILVLAVGAGIGIGAWIAPTSSTTAAGGLVGKAVTAAANAGSFHYVELSTTDGHLSRFVGDAGANEGRQSITATGKSGNDVFELRLVGGVVYFRGNTAAVVDQLFVPAATAPSAAGHWVKVVKGDAPYKTLAEGITAKSNISQLSTAFSARSSSSVPGSSPPTTRVVGNVKATGHVLPGTAVLVLETSTSLPQRFAAEATSGTAHLSMRWTFGQYHEKVSVSAPNTSESYSSLGATPPSTG